MLESQGYTLLDNDVWTVDTLTCKIDIFNYKVLGYNFR